MGLIYEPIKDYNIVYYTMYSSNHQVINTDKFKTLKELREFFYEHKRKGEVVGYVIIKDRTPGFKDYVITGKLAFEWTDQTGYGHKEFDNVHKFVEFLQEYPVFAKLVGYVKK